jgi:hypothetical protein
MGAAFLLNVLQTAVGTALGFLLGIWAFHYQQEQLEEKRKADDRRAAHDALQRLTVAAGLNLEALAHIKLQIVNELFPEAKQMQQVANANYNATKIEEKKKNFDVLKATAESARWLYISMPKVPAMPPPEVREYSSLMSEMPALSLFVHRAEGMIAELNERIVSRNALIAKHSSENTSGQGMQPQRHLYFAGMLADEGMAICENTDLAMYCWKLASDQIDAYMRKKAPSEPYARFELVDQVVDQLPKEDLLPLMSEQLVTFSEAKDRKQQRR